MICDKETFILLLSNNRAEFDHVDCRSTGTQARANDDGAVSLALPRT